MSRSYKWVLKVLSKLCRFRSSLHKLSWQIGTAAWRNTSTPMSFCDDQAMTVSYGKNVTFRMCLSRSKIISAKNLSFNLMVSIPSKRLAYWNFYVTGQGEVMRIFGITYPKKQLSVIVWDSWTLLKERRKERVLVAFSNINMISGFRELNLWMFNLEFHNTNPFLSLTTLQVSTSLLGDRERSGGIGRAMPTSKNNHK